MSNQRYYVKRSTGKVFGPFDTNAITMMLKSNKLSGDAEISTDKESWEPITSVPQFAAEASGASKGTIMGGWDAGAGKPELPRPSSGGPPRLPVPKGGGAQLPRSADGRPELPARSGGAELPASTTSGGAELPASSQGAALPASKSSGPQLPTPSRGGPELPGRTGAELPGPTSKNAELPASTSNDAELPGVRNVDLPGSKASSDDLFAPTESDADLFADSSSGDDLFGAPEDQSDDLFGAPDDDDDDLFGAPDDGDDDLFGAPDDGDDDLFGAPDSGDDLFGTPDDGDADDDLFGNPVGGPGSSFQERSDAIDPDADDLFGGPDPGDEGDDDLFDSPVSGRDDFLGGDGGFSFLDDEPPPADAPDWEDDLFGDEPEAQEPEPQDDWGEQLLQEAERKPEPRKVESIYDDDDPFRPASPGIRDDEEEEEVVASATDEAKSEDRGRGKFALVAIPVVLIVAAGIGYLVYSNFFGNDVVVSEPAKVETGPADVELASLKSDNYGDFQRFLGAKSLAGDDREAKLLLVESLALSRYDDPALKASADTRAAKFSNASEGFPALARGAWEAQAANADAARAYLEPLAAGDSDVAYFANLFMGIGDVKAVIAEIEKNGIPGEASPEKKIVPAADAAPTQDAQPDAGTTEDDDSGAVATAEEPDAEPSRPTFGGLADRARAALNSAAKKAPDAPAPHYWMGRLDAALGNEADALARFQKGADAMETHVPTQLELGRIYYDKGDLNDAIDHLEKVSGPLSAFAHVSETADAFHIAGMVHVARRQSDLAIEAFTKALNADPSRTDTLSALAEEYENAQKYQEALNFFTTNQSLGQNNSEVMLGIVRSHIGLEQWNQAIAQLEEGQKAFPDDARFPYYLGQLHLRRGAFFDAKKAFERSIEIDPGLLTAQANLAKLAWRMDKDVVKGEEYVAEIVQRPTEIDAEVASQVADFYADSERPILAEQWYRMALQVNPNHWPARLSLSRLLLGEGRFEDATTLLERARDEGVQDIRLQAYLADAYRQAGQYDRAIDAINKVIAEFPKNEEYVFIRGRIHFDRGNYDTAREDFNRAYELNPRYHEAYFYVGRTAHAKGDYNTALKIFRHVLDYMPDRGDFHYFMAMTLEELNRTAQALDEYRKATAVDADFGEREPMVYIRRGRLLSRLNYTVEGRRDIERALEIAPANVESLLAMGELEYRDKNYKPAIDHFRRALERQPERPSAQYQLGMALIYDGQKQPGAKRLQLAIKHGYEDPEVYRTLGYTYKELGQRALAIESFKQFLRETQDEQIPATTTKEMVDQIKELGG